MATLFKYGIVGVGPRGSYALERLVEELDRRQRFDSVRILLFEETEEPGNGPVWSTKQAPTNWLNISERSLALPRRPERSLGETTVPGFPSYHEWAGLDFESWPQDRIDTYPPRSKLGRYLRERHLGLRDALVRAGVVEWYAEEVSSVSLLPDSTWQIATVSGNALRVDDLLLTIGHQPTRRDDQMAGWKQKADGFSGLNLVEQPYSNDAFFLSDLQGSEQVAIRGYGLAMIDVARRLAESAGTFTAFDLRAGSGHYEPRGPQSELRIVPFSLDGLTMAPKPIDPSLDARFEPEAGDLENLARRLGDRVAQSAAQNEQFLIDEIVPIAAEVYRRGGWADSAPTSKDLSQAIDQWLNDSESRHEWIVDPDSPPAEALGDYIEMAIAKRPASLDYCVGQVWRHCQPTLYSALSHSDLSDETMARIISLDERMKRYAYGPPVESAIQLQALYNAGVLVLDFLKDPAIELTASGWSLHHSGKTFVAPTMIDSVLSSPSIEAVDSALVRGLLRDEAIRPVQEGLGIVTDPNGYVQSARDDSASPKLSGSVLPMALLGRLAKGTVIGVDAILECFGERPRDWARAAAMRADRA